MKTGNKKRTTFPDLNTDSNLSDNCCWKNILSLLTDRRLMEQFGLRHRLVLASVKEQDFGKKKFGGMYSINNLARGKIITNTSLCGILISWVLKYHCPFNILIE